MNFKKSLIKMKIFKNLCLVSLLFLPACKTLDTMTWPWKNPEMPGFSPYHNVGDDQIPDSYRQARANSEFEAMLADIDGPRFPKPTDRDLRVITDKMAGSDVELYDLDQEISTGRSTGRSQGQPQGQPRAFSTPPAPLPQGLPAATEPSVTIYPLDDNGNYPGASSFVTPAPESPYGAQWPNNVLPADQFADQFGGNQIPSNVWGNQAMMQQNVSAPGQQKIFFAHGSAALDREDLQTLNNVAQQARFSPVNRIDVEGHASRNAGTGDPVLDRILNLKESMNRSFSVSKALIQKGVPPEKIRAVAYGDTMPPMASPSGNVEAISRRVEIRTGN